MGFKTEKNTEVKGSVYTKVGEEKKSESSGQVGGVGEGLCQLGGRTDRQPNGGEGREGEYRLLPHNQQTAADTKIKAVRSL